MCGVSAVHCGSIRQTASILSMSRDCLRTGDKALVRFRFIKHPEYLKRGQRMVSLAELLLTYTACYLDGYTHSKYVYFSLYSHI